MAEIQNVTASGSGGLGDPPYAREDFFAALVERRHPAQQRLALLHRYGGCAVETCDRPFEWCHMHHINPWETGGDTNLDNLIPVCTRHHTQIHDGRLAIERTDGIDHWTRPANPHRNPDELRQRRKDRAHQKDSAAARRSPFATQAASAQ